MSKYRTSDVVLNKSLKRMNDDVDEMKTGFLQKQDMIKVVTETPQSETMGNGEMKFFTDNSNNAKLYFKDNVGNVYSIPLNKE